MKICSAIYKITSLVKIFNIQSPSGPRQGWGTMKNLEYFWYLKPLCLKTLWTTLWDFK